LGCVIGISLLAIVSGCDDGAVVTVQPSACLKEFPRADASVADEMTIDQAVTECEDDDGACQASATCSGSAEGRDCDANKLISAAAAACIAAEAGLEQGIGDFRTGLTYHYGYRRIIWDVSNVLFDHGTGDASNRTSVDKGGESIAVDAISGQTYEVLSWQALSSAQGPGSDHGF
jgi:hypothetical protein